MIIITINIRTINNRKTNRTINIRNINKELYRTININDNF